MKKTLMLSIAAAILAPALLRADDGDAGRGVARLSVINGDVSVRRGDSGDTVAAAINAPLVVQDRVVTGSASRAEIQFDFANMMRIGSDADVRLSELDYHRYQVQVAVGTTTFRVLRDLKADVEIATPSVSVRPVKKGTYRVTVREDGSSEITVRSGEAEIYTPRGSERLGSGRTMIARGSASDPEFQVTAAIPRDDWDGWNENRDRDLERTHSYQYVSPDMYGAEDLDAYGRWVDVAPYGYVWTPAAAAGWAPYRYGRWVWMDWYGWTWVSYDPWGWAPYHYGRWFYSGPYGWCWYPGPVGPRYSWSPALVAFFGWGSYGGFHSGIGFGWGNVGWVPLAPHDPFHRWWGPGYYGHGGTVNNVTIVNNTNITNIYANARRADAVTGMAAEQFGRAHVTSANMVRPGSGDMSRAGLVQGQLPLAPTRASLALSDRTATAQARTGEGRQFFSHRQPAAVDRVPFEAQRTAVRESARTAFGGGSPAVADTPRGAGMDNGRGMRPQTSPTASGGVAAQPVPAATPESRDTGRGWRRFEGGSSASGGPANTPTPAPTGRGASPQVVEPGRSTVTPAPSGDGGTTAPRQADDHSGRFGSRGGSTPATPAPTTVAPQSNDSGRTAEQERWSRFGDRGGSRGNTPQVTAPTPTPEPNARGGDRGGSRGAVPQVTTPSPRPEPNTRGGDRGSWQRFGEPRSNTPAPEPRRAEPPRQEAPRPAEPQKQDRTAPADRGGRNDRRSDASDGWQRFNTGAGQTSRGSEPGARSAGSFNSGGRSEAVRINPPIVRERSAYGGGGGSFGRPAGPSGGGQAARSAPSGGGGHAGGGPAPARSGGGGGGNGSGRSGRSR